MDSPLDRDEYDFSEVAMPLPSATGGGWDENIAERIVGEPGGESALQEITDEILDLIEADKRAREPWEKMAAQATRLTGIVPLEAERGGRDGATQIDREGKAPDWWQSKVIHPLLGDAIARYQARASREINPPEGPAKGSTIGENPSEETQKQAKRAARYLNDIYTRVSPEMLDQTDRLLWVQATEGTVFTKNAWSPTHGGLVRSLIRMQDLWIPSHVEAFDEAPRHTHRMHWSPGKVRALMDSGYLRRVDLERKAGDPSQPTVGDKLADAAIGLDREPSGDTALRRDRPYEMYECHIDYDLAGPGLPDREARYVVTIEPTSRQTLRISTNWREINGLLLPWRQVTPYYFLAGPHPGPYGAGLYHLIGGLSETATVLLRAVLDTASYHAHPSGFIEKAITGMAEWDSSTIKPGEFRGVPLPIDDLRKGIMALPIGDIASMFQILEFVVGAGQRFASTPDIMTGNADPRSPVGTILALIEKGSEIPTSIHARTHRSQTRELQLQAALIGAYIDPAATYPWEVEEGENNIIARDFDMRVDVEPVADPRISSQSQRLAKAEGVLQLTLQAPDLYDRREAHKRMLEAIGEGDIDKLLKPEDGPPRCDAVTENARMTLGQPIQAWPDQDHQAHIVVHEAAFKRLPIEGQKLLYPVHVAHLAEHVSLVNRLQAEAMMSHLAGQPLAGIMPPPPMPGPNDPQHQAPPMDPQTERMIDGLAAQAAQLMGQVQPPYAPDIGAPPTAAAGGGDGGKQADPAIEQQKLAIQQAKVMADATAADAKSKHDETMAGAANANAMTQAHKVDQDAAMARLKIETDAQIAREKMALDVQLERERIAADLEKARLSAAQAAAGIAADLTQDVESQGAAQRHEQMMQEADHEHADRSGAEDRKATAAVEKMRLAAAAKARAAKPKTRSSTTKK